jgi:beta-glucanase (GH16 family)
LSGLAGCASASPGEALFETTPPKLESAVTPETLAAEMPEPILISDGYKMIWNDEFDGLDGNAPDEKKWAFQEGTGTEYGLTQWGNNEAQYYLPKNASVKDGRLFITAKKESHEGMAYTSARLFTQPTFSFQYGRVEARIQLTGVPGLWPAFWLLPLPESGGNNGAYGTWAASGEMDIMENRGRMMSETSGAAHYGGAWPNNVFSGETYHFPENESAEDFHVYALEWRETELKWFVDDNLFFTLTDWYTTGADGSAISKPAPFDKPFYILLNCAVGGQFDGGVTPPETFEQADMIVDYVRVFQK